MKHTVVLGPQPQPTPRVVKTKSGHEFKLVNEMIYWRSSFSYGVPSSWKSLEGFTKPGYVGYPDVENVKLWADLIANPNEPATPSKVEKVILEMSPAEFLSTLRISGQHAGEGYKEPLSREKPHGIAPAGAFELFCALDDAAIAAGIRPSGL